MQVGEGCVEHLVEPADVELEPAGAQFQGVAADQFGQAGRELVGARHPGPLHQDGDDPHVVGQRRLDLQAHEVLGVVQPGPAPLVGDGEPPVPDQRQQHVAGADRGGDHLDEVIASWIESMSLKI